MPIGELNTHEILRATDGPALSPDEGSAAISPSQRKLIPRGRACAELSRSGLALPSRGAPIGAPTNPLVGLEMKGPSTKLKTTRGVPLLAEILLFGSSGFCVGPPVLAWVWQEAERTSPDERGPAEPLPGRNAETDRVCEGISEGCRPAETGRVAPRGERGTASAIPKHASDYRPPTQKPEEPIFRLCQPTGLARVIGHAEG